MKDERVAAVNMAGEISSLHKFFGMNVSLILPHFTARDVATEQRKDR